MMLDSFAALDAIALAVLILSAIMGFSRGFLRELATVGALFAALTAAYFARRYFHDDVVALLPEGMQTYWANIILIGVAFVVVYVAVAWFGQHLSKSIRGMEGISMPDRLAGIIFGLARGFIALLFFIVLIGIALTDDRVPRMIGNSMTYKVLKPWADSVRGEAEAAGKDASHALPKSAQSGL
jgi:membrane protein required for colicin V production